MPEAACLAPAAEGMGAGVNLRHHTGALHRRQDDSGAATTL